MESGWQKGQMYVIINEGEKQALRVELISGGSEVEKVLFAKPNHQDLCQLFFVENLGNDNYEILNASTGHCLDEEGHLVKLKKTKQANDQLFYIEQAKTNTPYKLYWIKTHKDSKKALALEGTLRVKQLDTNDATQLFNFQPVADNQIVNKSLFIVNQKSGKVLDIPKGTDQVSVGIIQYQKNNRFHQRWNLLRNGDHWDIRSFKNGLCLDIEHQKCHENAKVVQWKPMGKQNQLWIMQKNEQGPYKIRPAMDPNLFLGILNDSTDNGASLGIVKHQTLWRIEGPVPE